MYPKITDNNFDNKIDKIFKKYKTKEKKTFKEICFPNKYELQPSQKFPAEYINPKTPYNSILIYHKIGSGKTCTAIRIAEEWKHKRKIHIVLPASLRENFLAELRTQCSQEEYISKKDELLLTKLNPIDYEYINIIKKTNKRIDKYYNIYSYNKFIDNINKINLEKSLLIIDEAHNLISETGMWYKTLINKLDKVKDIKIVLMTATPIVDKPSEFALLFNLLKPINKLPTDNSFNKMFISNKNNIINSSTFIDYIRGYVSYDEGAPSYVYPETIIKYVKVELGYLQKKYYKIISSREKVKFSMEKFEKLPNFFYIGTRMVSNIVFPNGLSGNAGFKSLTKNEIINNLEKYSGKIYRIIEKIKKCTGKVFVYSGFKEYAGIMSIVKILNVLGYKDFNIHGSGKKRYVVWSSDDSLQKRNLIKTNYNHPNNVSGQYIKILLGSPCIKEGVSLMSVSQVHILEPYWNFSRIAQIIGRASRHCSHKLLPKDLRNIKVYIYVGIINGIKTVDQFIIDLAKNKQHIIDNFQKIISENKII